jgi:hypothetical protein
VALDSIQGGCKRRHVKRLIVGTWLAAAAVVVAGTLATVIRSSEPPRRSVQVSSSGATAPGVGPNATATSAAPATTTTPRSTVPVSRPTTVPAPETPETTATTEADVTEPPPISPPTTAPTAPVDISWETAAQLIRTCQVASVTQSHSRIVVLVLKDGGQRQTVEPQLDMQELRSPPECGPVVFATE